MKSAGLFFLRSRPYEARRTDGSYCYVFPLIEREGVRGALPFVGVWVGDEALAFVTKNPDLKSGSALRLDLDHLHAHENELRASIVACSLAPARWPSRDASQPSSYQPQQAAA